MTIILMKRKAQSSRTNLRKIKMLLWEIGAWLSLVKSSDDPGVKERKI